MENWKKELELWAPDIEVVTYWGSQDERRHLRLQHGDLQRRGPGALQEDGVPLCCLRRGAHAEEH